MQKERVVEPKAERSLVDSHKSSVRESVWWAWHGLNRLLDV